MSVIVVIFGWLELVMVLYDFRGIKSINFYVFGIEEKEILVNIIFIEFKFLGNGSKEFFFYIFLISFISIRKFGNRCIVLS